MDCQNLTDLMADYLGNELPTETEAAIDAHLQECDACRGTVADLRETLADLTTLQTVADEEADRLVAALPPLVPGGRAVRRQPHWMGTALRTAAAVLIGVFLGRWTAAPDPAAQPPSMTGTQILTVPGMAGAAPVHPGWIEAGREVDGTASTFARRLALLGRTLGG